MESMNTGNRVVANVGERGGSHLGHEIDRSKRAVQVHNPEGK